MVRETKISFFQCILNFIVSKKKKENGIESNLQKEK